MTKLIAMCLLLAAGNALLHAQSEARKAEIINEAGDQAGSAFLSTYEAVNMLGDAWQRKIFEDPEALELATSYRESAELTATLLKGKSAPLEKACDLLVKQATALEAWIKIGDDALGETYRKLQAQTRAAVLNEKSPAPSGEPQIISLRTISSVGHDGKTGPLGTMTVTKTSEDLPVQIKWTYPNGGSDRGLGVPMAGTGKLAAFFGNGVKTISLYRRQSGEVTGRWVSTSPDSTIRDINLKQGANKTEYKIEGGGQFLLSFKEGMIADVVWKYPSGDTTGIAIGDSEFLAVAALEEDAKAGVALYTMAKDGKSATARWTVAGAPGAVEDTLEVTGITGGKPTVETANANEDEVLEIARVLQSNLGAATQWKPTSAQIEQITATPEDAKKLAAYVDNLYPQLPDGKPAAKAGQTEVRTRGPDLDSLPGGYAQHIDHFKSGIEIYGFKYVEPGETFGMSYDGLFNVEGEWIFIPKAWRAFAD